jgi:hypothetical protein
MFARVFFAGAATLALLCAAANPGLVHAQRSPVRGLHPAGGKMPFAPGGAAAHPFAGKMPLSSVGKTSHPTAAKIAHPTVNKLSLPTGGKVALPTGGKIPLPTAGKIPFPLGGKIPLPTAVKIPPPTGGKIPLPTGGKTPNPTGGKIPKSPGGTGGGGAFLGGGPQKGPSPCLKPDPMHHYEWAKSACSGHQDCNRCAGHDTKGCERGRGWAGRGWGGGPLWSSFGPGYGYPFAASAWGGWPGAAAVGFPQAGFAQAGGLPGGLTGSPSIMSAGDNATYPPSDVGQLMRAYAEALKVAQDARILGEMADSMRLENIKKGAETQKAVQANTPTWTERQAQIGKQILARAQTTSTASDIVSGQALNVLLQDLRKLSGDSSSASTPLSEDVLGHINVAPKNGRGNLGLLRNEGNVDWPSALERVVPSDTRSRIQSETQAMVEQAMRGDVSKRDVAALKDLLNGTRDKLAKTSGIDGGRYLEAKRFLNAFDAACLALEKGEAGPYFRFQKWSRGGKTIQEVADYMLREGLQFASALDGDEQAYRTVHSALAAYDVDLNQLASGATASNEQR